LHELQAIELDSWAEYSLLKIDQIIDIDREPIYLLKMTKKGSGQEAGGRRNAFVEYTRHKGVRVSSKEVNFRSLAPVQAGSPIPV
jgi:hypothetical protein